MVGLQTIRSASRHVAAKALAFLLLLLCLASNVRADQTIYDDALRNGWANWSWCATDLGASGYVHSGASSAQVTYTAAWQGFYLSHNNFDSSGFTALRFWIHGGGFSGRTISVAALVNGQAQAAVALSAYTSISATDWQPVTIPLTDLHVDHNPLMSGFWLQEAAGAPEPTFYVDDVSLVSAPPPAVVHLAVDARRIVQQVDRRMFGVNAAVWDGQFGSGLTATLLRTMGTQVLRFPGGSLSDSYHWQTDTTDGNTWRWATDFDAFAGTAKSVGADAFITVNYGSGSPQEAADWVAYSNNTRKYGFRYWEIGNECYGSWENDAHSPAHDPYTYAVQARDYMAAMKAADPTIKIGVVVVTGEDSFANNTSHPAVNPRTKVVHNGWTPVLFSTLRALGVRPDFVVYHRYEQAPGQESDSVLLQAAATWRNDAADIRQQINDYFGAAGSAVEIDCTENNSVFSNPGKQSTSLVNGLYFADSLGQLIQTEFRSLVWWDMRNGVDASNNNSASLYGWRAYGDYGITGENGAYPVYYIAKLMRLFMGAGDYVAPATSDYNLVSIAAVKQRSGKFALLVINKSPDFTLNTSVSVIGFAPHASAVVYRYGMPNDDNARTGRGSPDISVSRMVNAGGTFSMTFPPYSATVLVLTRSR